MHQTAPTPARERKLARRSTDHINLAVADILLALDRRGLQVHEQLIALHEATNDRLGKPHKLVYVTAG